MATITQQLNPRGGIYGDVLVGASQLGGTTTITGASGTISLGALPRVDDTYYVTSTAATTLLLPPVTTAGYKTNVVLAAGSVGTLTVRNSGNTATIGAALVPGSSMRVIQLGTGIESWSPAASSFAVLGASGVNVAKFTGTTNGSGNGTLNITSLGLSATPVVLAQAITTVNNRCYQAVIRARSSSVITYETWNNNITVLIGGNTSAKIGNVTVDFAIVY